MNCIKNIDRTQIPNDIIVNYIDIYKSVGKNPYFLDILKSDLKAIERQNIERESYFFSKVFGNEISENRLKVLLLKDTHPKNKDEVFVTNIKRVFTKIQSNLSTFDLTSNEIQSLARFLYKGVASSDKIQFGKILKKRSTKSLLDNQGNINKRKLLDELIDEYLIVMKKNEYENSLIIINFYIDFVNTAPFNSHNEIIGLIVLYILLIKNGFEVFKYISFFEQVFRTKDSFNHSIMQANYNWKDGFSQVMPLHRLVINYIKESYSKLQLIIRDYEFENQLNKSDNIENTISKFPEIFTKDEIREIHPFISESTINRTLKKLREEGKIRPLGKGRSAKWIRLFQNERGSQYLRQLNLDI